MYSAFPPQCRESRPRQHGFATVLLIVLVGLALTATGFGVMHTTKSTQQKAIAVNSVTQAQTGAWVATDAFRRYLATLDGVALGGLSGSLDIDLGNGQYGAITAQNIDVVDTGSGTFQVTAEIVNRHEASRSSVILDVAYKVSAGGCSSCNAVLMSLDFHDDLEVNGGIEVLTPEGTLPNLNIDGNVEINNLTISELGDINATGNATLGSGVQAENLHANGNVTLTASASLDKLVALGWLEADGSSSVEVSWVNGYIDLASGGRFENVNSRSDITISAGTHGNFKANGNVIVVDTNGIDSVQAVGNVSINGWGRVSEVLGMGNLQCQYSGWSQFTSLSVNGSKSANCPGTAAVGASNSVTPMAEQTPYSMPEMVVDVWPLRGDANYVFEYDTGVGKMKVTVSNIAGIASGTEFYVGRYGTQERGYLCGSTNASGVCNDGSTPELALCLGFSLDNDCLTYNSATQTWNFSATSIAPGIMWFEGNVTIDTGVNYTTVLATGNILGQGDYLGFAANKAGYDEVCLASGSDVPAPMKAEHHARFAAHYPTNLCDIGATDYKPTPAGNIGLAAGGYDPDGDGSYSGGDIKMMAMSDIYGSVLAGNVLRTLGNTNIYGYVSAANLGANTSSKNLLGASTTIDLRQGTDDYNPAEVPFMGDQGGAVGGGTPSTSEATMVWARYL